MMSDDPIDDITIDTFKRVDATHPIDWRFNDSDPPTKLVLKSKIKPSEFIETKGVQIISFKQKTGEYAIVFVLKDPLCADIFKSFCDDVIESSREIDPDDAADFAYERYIKWMYLFKPCISDRLSDKEIRGLIGELYSLKTIFIPKYGALPALKSWMNHLKGKQDFIEYDLWFEVKTLLEGNETIHISSLEQLSRDDEGELVIVNIKKTSSEDTNGITLNSIYNQVLDYLPTFSLKKHFAEIVLSTGYVPNDPYYDDRCFEIVDAAGYSITGEFPRLTQNNIPYPGIAHVEYEILIDSIKPYEVERWN